MIGLILTKFFKTHDLEIKLGVPNPPLIFSFYIWPIVIIVYLLAVTNYLLEKHL